MFSFHRKMLEKCGYIEAGFCFYVDREPFTRVRVMRQCIVCPVIELIEKRTEVGLKGGKCLGCVLYEQTVIHDQLYLGPVERQAIFVFQELRSDQRRTCRLNKFLLIGPAQLFLTVIKQAEPPCPLIETVIGFMPDQHDARSVVDM